MVSFFPTRPPVPPNDLALVSSQYPACGRKFTRRADCLRHVKIHLDERPFACPDCPKRFIQRHALVVHMRKHTGERPFACDVCDRKFTEVG